MRKACMILIVFLLIAPLIAVAGMEIGSTGYSVRVDYIISSTFEISVDFEENEMKEISAPPAPVGYVLASMEISAPEDFPSDLAAVKFDRKMEDEGIVRSLVSYDGVIKLAYGGSGNYTLNALLKCVYTKTVWEEIPTNGVVVVDVEAPEEPFGLANLTVRISVDNYAPFAVQDVVSPYGDSLVDPVVQESLHPDAVKVDLKNVELNFAYGLDEGEYKIVFKRGDELTLPNAFVVKEIEFYNGTIGGFETKTFTAPTTGDWRIIGYVVVLYSLYPNSGDKMDVSIEASMADYAYFEDKNIRIEGVSYLIPPLNFKLWIKAYIVYGSWFKVISRTKRPINILYTPVLIKSTGEWTRQGLKARISENEIKDATFAYLVVQLPSYGRIKNIVAPSGALGEYKDSLLPWASAVRSISVLKNQAYIQVKNGEAVEPGVYTVEIEWEPIEVKALDADGYPISGAQVVFKGPVTVEAETGEDGVARVILYHPGVYEVAVTYRSIQVGGFNLYTVTSTHIEVKCSVYNLEIETVDMWGRTLAGTTILIKSENDSVVASGETDDNGLLMVKQIPGGYYTIEATYKRVKTTFNENIDSSKRLRLTLDVAFELPLIGIPISKMEALGLLAGSAALGIAGYAASNRKKTTKEEDIVELESFE
ncbi:MAG: hypothetical protein DRJ44_03725 [Thermoprotei archaeon]|nr:MAG: hypothetical protein DRJ44_03725 [Thermoprotei archaeon]